MKLQFLTIEGCLYCSQAKKILEEIKPNFPDLEVEEIDIVSPKGQKIVREYGITTSPGIIIDGKLFSTGSLNKEKLIKKLKGE